MGHRGEAVPPAGSKRGSEGMNQAMGRSSDGAYLVTVVVVRKFGGWFGGGVFSFGVRFSSQG